MIQQWEKDLARLKKTNPAHMMIPVIEQRGYDHLSHEYVKLALADPIDRPAADVTLDSLFQQKSSLYSRRAVYSNKFHNCNNDAERKEVSVAIQAIQTEIVENRRMLSAYLETGKLPDTPVKAVMPLDGRAKEKKLHSVTSSISYHRALLRKEKDQVKIERIKSKINELKSFAEQLAI